MQDSARRPLAGLFLGPFLGLALLGGCSHGQGLSLTGGGAEYDDDINVRPSNYRSDILSAMHAYLNDPIGVRDAGIGEPALKEVGGNKRYVVCVRFNAKKPRGDYGGPKEIAAVFVAGRFDRFVDAPSPRESANASARGSEAAHGSEPPRGPCVDATYAPFPELEKLSR
jgi:hypothetical protein